MSWGSPSVPAPVARCHRSSYAHFGTDAGGGDRLRLRGVRASTVPDVSLPASVPAPVGPESRRFTPDAVAASRNPGDEYSESYVFRGQAPYDRDISDFPPAAFRGTRSGLVRSQRNFDVRRRGDRGRSFRPRDARRGGVAALPRRGGGAAGLAPATPGGLAGQAPAAGDRLRRRDGGHERALLRGDRPPAAGHGGGDGVRGPGRRGGSGVPDAAGRARDPAGGHRGGGHPGRPAGGALLGGGVRPGRGGGLGGGHPGGAGG